MGVGSETPTEPKGNNMSDYFDTTTGEEISDGRAHEIFDEYLDEVLGEISVGTLTYTASRVLKEVDPIAYRCEFSDWSADKDNGLVESGYWVRVLTEDGEILDGHDVEWFTDEDDARLFFDDLTVGTLTDTEPGAYTVQLFTTSDDVIAETRVTV